MSHSDANSFPNDFDPSSCLLFLGSGFSVEATNIVGMRPPVGKGLGRLLSEPLALANADDFNLMDLATHAAKRGVDVYTLLNNQFTIKALSSDQVTILSQPWRRIYTTNYDDCAEFYAITTNNKSNMPSYSFEQPLPSRILARTIVHMHGYIHNCTKDNVLSQMVLTHYSYAEQRAKLSPWWGQFEKDLRTTEGIFFVGYSLGDFAVASYLTKNPAFARKTHFIVPPNLDEILYSRVSDYGILHPISVIGFADWCKSAKPARALTQPHSLQAFRYFDPHKDKKTPTQPTPVEIDALVTLGTFKLHRLLSTFPEPSYVVPRLDQLDNAVKLILENRTLIIHSNIGNGKSIFTNCLCLRLSELGFACFECRNDVTIPGRDIEFLKNERKPVIIFPTYDTAYATLAQLGGLPETVRYIIEINTSTLHVRSNEVYSNLLRPIGRVDVNRLSKTDFNQLVTLLDKAGIAPTNLRLSYREIREIRDLVLSIYKNHKVAQHISQYVTPLLSTRSSKSIFICLESPIGDQETPRL
jgi:SIR2-like protein